MSNEHPDQKVKETRHHHEDYEQQIYHLEKEIKRISDLLKECCDKEKHCDNKKYSEKEKSVCHACSTTELVKNGGFEVPGDGENTFKFWTIEIINEEAELASIGATDDSYEGVVAAQFTTEGSAQRTEKQARIFQEVPVTPGCLYRLSFAENFLPLLGDFDFAELTARVYYTDPDSTQYDLIKIFIRHDPGFEPIPTGYTYHQKVADAPVPCTVSTVTVEFLFNISDIGGQDPDNEWQIDGVSLRSEYATAICCS